MNKHLLSITDKPRLSWGRKEAERREKGKFERAEGRRERVGPGIWIRIPLGKPDRANARTSETKRNEMKRNETISWMDSTPNLGFTIQHLQLEAPRMG